MKLTAPIHRLKHKARLMARHAEASAGTAVLARLSPGDLLLVAARPGQGKTLLALEIAIAAARAGLEAAFFSLEYAQADIAARFAALGVDPATLGGRFSFDVSDRIEAGHIVRALAQAPRGSLAVVDYLQILDQRRETASLMEQVRTLKAFAAARGLILVFLSQVDRAYDPTLKPFPDLGDVRLPNPLDLALFDKAAFLHGGEVRFGAAA